MSYNEIMQALEQGQKVYWSNSAYKVFLDNGKLYCINEYNSYMTPLVEVDYKIEELKSLSKTKEYYSARFDYNLSDNEPRYKISLNEVEYKEREKFVKENNRITVQKWWESTGPVFNELKSYFNDEVVKYLNSK